MSSGIRGGFLAFCFMAMAAVSAHAENQTFADLLAEAKAQVAAGHRWTPPGNNMTETVMKMMDLVAAATPSELAQLSALLESDKTVSPAPERDKAGSPPPRMVEAPAEQRPAEAAPAFTPDAEPAPALTPDAEAAPASTPNAVEALRAFTTPAPTQDPVVSNHLAPDLGSRDQSSHAAPDQVQPGHAEPGPVGPGESQSVEINPGQTGPGQAGPMQVAPGQIASGQTGPGDTRPAQASPAQSRHAKMLFAKGLDAELRGDFSAARRYYLSAAQQGNAAAARNLGRLYDSTYLSQTALGGVDPDPALAQYWYEQALKLGDAQAGPLLQALSLR